MKTKVGKSKATQLVERSDQRCQKHDSGTDSPDMDPDTNTNHDTTTAWPEILSGSSGTAELRASYSIQDTSSSTKQSSGTSEHDNYQGDSQPVQYHWGILPAWQP